MFQLEEHYWWFVGRRCIIDKLLLQRGQLPPAALVLDVGCGSGGNIRTLEKFGAVVGVDISLVALTFCRRRHSCNLALSEGDYLPLRSDRFDLVTLLDVLEHTEDDNRALCEVHRVLKPGGKALITVPAYPTLWSEHDEALHHKRRYRSKELRDKAQKAGFRVLRMSHAISAVLAPVYLFRWLQRLRPRRVEPKIALVSLPAPVNRLLVAYLKMEARLIPRASIPFGVSIICLVQKPNRNEDEE